MMKKTILTAAVCAAATFAAAADIAPAAASAEAKPELKPGGKNRSAFSVDREKKMEDVLKENEARVRATRHKYAWSDFIALLDELKNSDRYIVCPGKDFIKTFDPDKVVVYMRHDIDVDPATALRMAEEEHKRGLKSTYYILPTAPYYGRQGKTGVQRYADMDRLYRKIQSYGHDIGVHNDLLAMMILWDIDPLEFQKQELAYYREAGFPVVGVVSHGSGVVISRKLNNTWIFSEFNRKGVYDNNGVAVEYGKHSFKDFGFIYEGYKIGHNTGTSDIAKDVKTGMGVVEKVKSFKPGDRVSLLTHPIHWGDNEPAPAKP